MKIISISNKLSNVIYLFLALRISYCSNLEKLKNVDEKINDLWFSFNIKTFDDFKSNINDEVLTKECIIKAPFGFRTSLGIFLNVFCIFYQNSRLLNEKKFYEVFKKFYDSSDQTPNKQSFDGFVIKKIQKMNEIVRGKNTCDNILEVGMKCNRVIIGFKNKINDNLREVSTRESYSFKNEIISSIIIFINRFHEMYIQGLLGKGYFDSLKGFFADYIEKGIDSANLDLSDPLYELFQLCDKVDFLIRSFNKDKSSETEEVIKGNSLLLIIEYFEKLASSVVQPCLNLELLEYPEVLMKKVLARAKYYYEENRSFLSFYSKEHAESIDILKKLLEEHLLGMKLSKESTERLVILCFELNV